MISLKALLVKKAEKLYRVLTIWAIVSLFVFICVSVLLLYTKQKENLELRMRHYAGEINGMFTQIEMLYNQRVKRLFSQQYALSLSLENSREAFSDEFISMMKRELYAVDFDILDIEQINYYRINKEGFIYESDYEPSMDLDASGGEFLRHDCQSCEPGEIILESLGIEAVSKKRGLYAYIKLPDETFFEVGIIFKGLDEFIQKKTDEIFANQKAYLGIFNDRSNPIIGDIQFSQTHEAALEQAIETGEPLLKLNRLTNAILYHSENSPYGAYNFIFETKFYYPLFAMITLAIIVLGTIISWIILKKKVEDFSERLTAPITQLEKSMSRFSLSQTREEDLKIETDVIEIQSIAESYMFMGKKIRDSYEELEAVNKELENSYCENKSLFEKMESLLGTANMAFDFRDTRDLLSTSFEKLSDMIGQSDYGLVSVVEEDRLRFIRGYGVDFTRLDSIELPVEKLMADKVVLSDFKEGGFKRQLSQEFGVSIEDNEIWTALDSIRQILAVPVKTEHKYYGHMTLYNSSEDKVFTLQDYRIAGFFTTYLKAFLSIQELTELESNIHKEIVYSTVKFLEHHDPYTKGHSENVATLASNFAHYLGLDERRVKDIYWAGIMHDIGKILIPNEILRKSSRLTHEEFEEIKKHPVYAYDVFKKSPIMGKTAVYIRHHHEKYNGKGYPDGLKGKAIPYESRILSLADAWDAMTSERIYKAAMSFRKALYEINRNKGEQFDPGLADKWIKFIHSSGLPKRTTQ